MFISNYGFILHRFRDYSDSATSLVCGNRRNFGAWVNSGISLT